jgi:hypothetical protein
MLFLNNTFFNFIDYKISIFIIMISILGFALISANKLFTDLINKRECTCAQCQSSGSSSTCRKVNTNNIFTDLINKRECTCAQCQSSGSSSTCRKVSTNNIFQNLINLIIFLSLISLSIIFNNQYLI